MIFFFVDLGNTKEIHVYSQQNNAGKHDFADGYDYIIANQDGELLEKSHRTSISKGMLNYQLCDFHTHAEIYAYV